jgi:hypothetical protein
MSSGLWVASIIGAALENWMRGFRGILRGRTATLRFWRQYRG